MSLGETWFHTPITGWWGINGYPDTVHFDGRLFRKARWKDTYPGVAEQYREAVVRDSMHLKVYANGQWVIDHVDQDNPDMGRPIEHFFNDHPFGKFLKGAAAVAAVGLAIAGIGIGIGAMVEGG